METNFITIGKLAQRMGVTVRTLQYYDREGLLSPSGLSEGGRRLYSTQDVVRLHQILAFKYLGFSLQEIKERIFPLDTPARVADILMRQHGLIKRQIEELRKIARSIDALCEEVVHIDSVDFKKYAEILDLIRSGNAQYWVWKLLDDRLSDHAARRFVGDPDAASSIARSYYELVDEGMALLDQGEPPQSEKSFAFAAKWWDMVMRFTGGDMSLLPSLYAYNDAKSKWDKATAAKQRAIDDYLRKALSLYFEKNGMAIPTMEDEHELRDTGRRP